MLINDSYLLIQAYTMRFIYVYIYKYLLINTKVKKSYIKSLIRKVGNISLTMYIIGLCLCKKNNNNNKKNNLKY